MYLAVFITTPDIETAKKISKHLLEKRLASCINMAPVKSMYWWEGKIEESDEVLLIVKTTTDKLNDLVKEAKSVHPYQLPEVVAVPIVGGLREYLAWVEKETHA